MRLGLSMRLRKFADAANNVDKDEMLGALLLEAAETVEENERLREVLRLYYVAEFLSPAEKFEIDRRAAPLLGYDEPGNPDDGPRMRPRRS